MLPHYLIDYLKRYLEEMDDDSFIVSGNLQLPDMKTLQRKLKMIWVL